MLDRVAASSRLINGNSVHYIAMVVAAHLGEVCRQRPEPATVQVETSATSTAQETQAENVTPPQQEAERPNEDEARSVDTVSVDSSELTNRFANMDQNEEEDGSPREEEEENDGERTPQIQPQEEEEQQMEVEQPTAQTEEQPTDRPDVQNEQEASAAEQPAEQQENQEEPGPSGLQQDEADPDGIDPAFLAALPEDIRQEVILDHQRQRRLNQLQQRQRQQSNSVAEPAAPNNEGNAPVEENQPPAEEDVLDQEFLAALPPELQEEVLAQHEQRLAQQAQRNAAANQNADAPAADAIAFLDSLNPTLRAQVLADADESVIQILPENLAQEANRIRRDYEHEVS